MPPCALALVPTALLAAGVTAPSPEPAPEPRVAVVFSGPWLEGRYTARVAMPASDQAGQQKVRDAIAGELALAESVVSTTEPTSDVSRLNAYDSTQPLSVQKQTIGLLELARRVSEASGGGFDVTARPLAEAWGLVPPGRQPETPSAEQLTALRGDVGYLLLALDAKRSRVTKTRPGVRCGLLALADGWLADRMAAAIAALGFRDVLVDLGGTVAARGRRADGRKWHVALQAVGPDTTSPGPVLELEDAVVATVGDYRAPWTDAAGRERSHVLDPRTGEPATNPLAAASVVDRDGARAEAIARALLVLGPEDAGALAAREQLAARLVERRPDGTLAAFATPALEALLVP
jgi:thiamine biosynthesis lipoprotein